MSSKSHLFSIHTHMTRSERLLLLELAKTLPNYPTIVEIGSYLGASTCFLAEGLLESEKEGKIFAVDTWTNIGMSEGNRETYEEFINNIQGYQSIITPLRGLSTEIVDDFDHEIDLLFIDGDHSYQGASSDLRKWLPKVKEGGIVICHDFSWAEGVRKAVREYLVPFQIAPGWQIDTIYWSKISHKRSTAASEIDVTVVVPTYQRQEHVFGALRSLVVQKTDFDFEILVLDNDCDPKLKADVLDFSGETSIPVRYIPVREIGLHNGRNLGAVEGLGEIIVYIDDDVITPPGWLAAICQPFEDSAVGGVGGKVLPQWETPPSDWVKSLPPSYFSLLNLGEISREMSNKENPYGCNMAFRRDLILSLEGFPPDGVGGGWIEWRRGDGETGFSQKVRQDGYKLMYQADAWLYHCIPTSRQTLEFARRRTMKSAISSAYSKCRELKLSRAKIARQVAQCVYQSIIPTARYLQNIPQPLEKRLRYEMAVFHNFALIMYQVRVIFDSDLRRWINKTSYWSTKAES
jgi:glycosyltransferase involved in cell wall biosynthesis/predicted O-methyltransferase YrrM